MKKLMFGLTAAAFAAGCTSNPEATAKTMDILGTVAGAVLEATQPPPPPPPRTVIVQQPVVVAQPAIVQQPVVVQQPVIQQPVIQQPVVQAPAAPVAPAAPAVAAPAAPQVDVSAYANVSSTAADAAEPEFKYGTLKFKVPATAAQIAAAKQKIVAEGKTKLERVRLKFEKGADEATVTAALVQFPDVVYVEIDGVKFTAPIPFALMRGATHVEIKNIKGLNLAGIEVLGAKIESLRFSYSQIADLTPLAGLTELSEVDFYGAEIADFSPLAACPKLRQIGFYAAKCTPEGYASLGNLKQVTKFHGGLTKMTSLAWVRQVPQATELKIFAEKIPDLTPIQSLPNLTYLRVWNMDGGNLSCALGDLALLANNKQLRRLELPGSRYSNLEALAALTELESLDLSYAKQPVDVSVVARLPKLKRLSVYGAQVVNGSAIPATVSVSKDKKTTGL